MTLKSAWTMTKETVSDFAGGPALTLSAATAYYAVFSIAPLLVLVVGLAGLVFWQQAVGVEVGKQLGSYVGPKATSLIQSMMSAQMRGGTLMASIIGAVTLIFGATAVFSQMQTSLNAIWGVTARPGYSYWVYLRDRLLSLAMLLGIGFLLLVSMALSTFVNAFTHYIGVSMSLPDWLVPTFEELSSFVVTSMLFAAILKFLPDVQIRWRDVLMGTLITAVLFTGGKYLLGRYLSHEVGASAYGAGSAFIVILLYVYYSSLILYLGAEFTKVYTEHCGTRIQPSRYAVRVSNQTQSESAVSARREQHRPQHQASRHGPGRSTR